MSALGCLNLQSCNSLILEKANTASHFYFKYVWFGDHLRLNLQFIKPRKARTLLSKQFSHPESWTHARQLSSLQQQARGKYRNQRTVLASVTSHGWHGLVKLSQESYKRGTGLKTAELAAMSFVVVVFFKLWTAGRTAEGGALRETS